MLARTSKVKEAEAAFAQAREAFTRAGAADRAARIDYFLAGVAAKRQDWPRAVALLAGYLAGKPRDADAYALLARVHRDGGGPGAAVAALEQAARALPDFVPLRLLLADECRRDRQPERAEAIYRKVLEKGADVAAYRGLITVLSERRGTQA